MKAERKSVESDLLVDVFFSNIVAGRDGITPEIGANGHWWIGGRDTNVLARAVNGTNGANGKNPNIGANGNWWLDGKDLGVKAKAPVISIGSNGHWLIDGADTAVPSNVDSFLSKTTTEAQAVAGNVTFNGNLAVKGAADLRSRACVVSNPSAVTDAGGWEIINIGEDLPRYICVLPHDKGARTKIVIDKLPEFGDMYVVFMASHRGVTIVSKNDAAKFWWGNVDDRALYETEQRGTAILHGWRQGEVRRWYVHTIGS